MLLLLGILRNYFKKNDMERPLVTIACTTYNHENFIEECIGGFLMQKTTFPIEIIIHDDASTDGTAKIVEEYANEHPELIVPVYQKVNQYSQGIKPWPNFVFPKARGKYIALCEGDDYWTDPYKLQKQVDFMKENPDCSLCFHNVLKTKENIELGIIKPKKFKQFFNSQDILINNGKEMATCSLLFKNDLLKKILDFSSKAPVGDFPLKLFLSEFGDIGYLPEKMAVYRYQTQNSWSAKKQTAIKQHYLKMKTFLNEYSNWSHEKNKKSEPKQTLDWKKKTLESPDSNKIGRYKLDLSSEQINIFNQLVGTELKLYDYKV